MRAAFQGMPDTPFFHRSSHEGAKCLMYVHVQMNNNMTTNKLEKSNRADIMTAS